MLDQDQKEKFQLFDENSLRNWLGILDLTENYLFEFKAKFYSGDQCSEEFII